MSKESDRELLELAAKAAGYEIEGPSEKMVVFPGHFEGGFSIKNARGGSSLWNPLTDDGDALRLVVKLRLEIDHNHPADQQGYVCAERRGCEGCFAPVSCVEDVDGEAYRFDATRRAIVRAAAVIGRAMQ